MCIYLKFWGDIGNGMSGIFKCDLIYYEFHLNNLTVSDINQLY